MARIPRSSSPKAPTTVGAGPRTHTSRPARARATSSCLADTRQTEPVPNKQSDSSLRPELAEVERRRRLWSDEARPDAVARRHATGRRTVREDLADLVDDGSWDEYGGFAVAARRSRRSVEELITSTPGDGVLTG